MRMKIQRRFHLTVRCLWDAPSIRAVWKSGGLHLKIETSNQRVGQRTSFTCTELHDFLRKQVAWTSVGAHFEPGFEEFPTENFQTFSDAVGVYDTHRWAKGTGTTEVNGSCWGPEANFPFGALHRWESNENNFSPKMLNLWSIFLWGSKKKWPLFDGPKWWITKIILGSPCNWQTALNDLFEVNASVRKWVLQVRISHCFFWGGLGDPSFDPLKSWHGWPSHGLQSSHSTGVSSAWIQYVLPGLMSRHKNHHGLVLKDMWQLSFRFPLRLYGKWTIVCKLAFVNKEFTYCSLLYTSSPDFHAFTFHWCGFDSLGMSRYEGRGKLLKHLHKVFLTKPWCLAHFSRLKHMVASSKKYVV